MLASHMRISIEIPDKTHRRLKSRAAAEGTSMRQLLLRGVEQILREPARMKVPRLSEPPCNKGVPGSLHLTNGMIADLLFP
jgi:hypothetical protein